MKAFGAAVAVGEAQRLDLRERPPLPDRPGDAVADLAQHVAIGDEIGAAARPGRGRG